MLPVSVRALARSFSISSPVLRAESSPRKRSSSIFASSSAIGCSKSRNCSGIASVSEADAVAADQTRELVDERPRRLHRPLRGELQRAARLAADVVHGDGAAPAAARAQDLLQAREQ